MGASELPENLAATREWLVARLPTGWKPELAIVCGSGLGGLVDALKPLGGGPEGGSAARLEFKYVDIPHFGNSTVHGHAGKLVFGVLGAHATRTVCMVGRLHLYEGHSMATTTYPMRIFSLLGVHTVLLTNAAGSLNHAKFRVGSVMMFKDHLNFPGMAGNNPLFGPNLDFFGPRFPATSDAYDKRLREVSARVANELGMPVDTVGEGVYAFVAGPSYETKAEARFLRLAGADVVGMSTVPEVVVARHCGLRVLALSLVTNLVTMGDDGLDTGDEHDGKATHEEVLQTSTARARDMQALVVGVIERMSADRVN